MISLLKLTIEAAIMPNCGINIKLEVSDKSAVPIIIKETVLS